MFIARTGYTGEDGFEIMLPADLAIPCGSDLIAADAAPSGWVRATRFGSKPA